MSQFENSEIMVKYAELMGGSLRKNANTRELVRNLGIDAAIIGGTAGAGALGIGSGGTAGAAGAVAGALGLGLSPLGLLAGGVLLVAGVGATIYYATRLADDNLRDLKERMGALDYKGTRAETIMENFLAEIDGHIEAFDIPPLTGDKVKDAETLSISVKSMEGGMEFLNRLSKSWPEIKKELTDWQNFVFNDPADFEEALSKTTANMKNVIASYKEKARRAANDIIKDTKDPSGVMREIKELHNQITNVWAAPIYNAKEKQYLEFGLRLSEGEVNMDEYKNYYPLLQDLRDELRDKILPAANRKAKGRRASVKNEIEKTAVELPDTPTASGVAGGTRQPISQRGPVIQRNDAVEELQNQLNILSVALDIPNTKRLVADGRYGPKTAQTVASVVKYLSQADPAKYPEQSKAMGELKRWGITENELGNVQLMNSNVRMMGVLFNTIDNIYQIHTGQKQRPMSQRDVQQPGLTQQPGAEPQQQYKVKEETMPSNVWHKQNPSPEEMVYAFKQIYDNIGGTRVNLYDYAKHNLGMSDQDIVSMLYAEFRGNPPKNWVKSTIVDALGSRYGLM